MDPITVFLVSLFALISASEFFLSSVLKYSKKIAMEKFFVGSIIIAISTSLPELFNSINSSLLGHGEIALGDIIGSCITNFGFVLGTLSLFRPFKIKKDELFFIRASSIAFVVLLFFLLDGVLSKIEGLILLILFLICEIYFLGKERKLIETKEISVREIIPDLLKPAIFLIFVVFLFFFLILSAIEISKILNVSTSIIGLSLIAFSTSFPEISIAILSSFKRSQKISFGDVVGSNILNICLILGIASIISEIKINKMEFLFPVMMYSIILLIVEMSANLRKGFSRIVGFALLSIYLFYMAGLPTFR